MTIGKRSVRGWLVCYAFMLAFFLVMVPTLAYADTYVGEGSDQTWVALRYLGYSPTEVADGVDYNFAAACNKAIDDIAPYDDGYDGWYSFVENLYQPLDEVNYNQQWWSMADGFMFSNQVDRARKDVAKIYDIFKSQGGGSAGSDEPVESEGYVYFRLQQWAPNAPFAVEYIRVSSVAYQNLLTAGASLGITEPKFFCFWAGSGGNTIANGSFDVDVLIGPSDAFELREMNGTRSYNVQWTGRPTYSFRQTFTYSNTVDTQFGRCVNVTSTQPIYSAFSGQDGAWPTYYVLYGYGTEVVPPEPEPEPEPEPPTPDPVPPDPDTPTPEPPRDPTPPTPDPTQPSQTIDLQGIIDRLDIIIRNQAVLINWLDDAFASVNANIQWLGSLFDNLTEWLSIINQNIQWLGELIDESFGWLWDVLGKLQASIDGGITRITTWLEMIYNRIGGQGGTVSRPQIDTPTPWDDFLSWLEGILQRLLDLIFGMTPTALQNLLSGLADLTTKFPFSIPWDLAALFALFVHAPVTPVADIPLMVPFANAPLPVHVDCSTWDGLAAIMRDGETVLFAAWLVMATPNFYRHLNNVSGAD